MNICIFGYGSLINRKSAERALKRKITLEQMIPAEIRGYKRAWRAGEQIWFDTINQQKTGVFLDLEKHEGSSVNGVLIEVSSKELDNIVIREKNYDCIDVTTNIEPKICQSVFTFISRPEYRVLSDTPNAYIPQEYIHLVENGCASFGEKFLEKYHETTRKSSLPVIKGTYRFINPDQAEYV